MELPSDVSLLISTFLSYNFAKNNVLKHFFTYIIKSKLKFQTFLPLKSYITKMVFLLLKANISLDTIQFCFIKDLLKSLKENVNVCCFKMVNNFFNE